MLDRTGLPDAGVRLLDAQIAKSLGQSIGN